MTERLGRRRYLQLLGAGTLASTAGCTGGGTQSTDDFGEPGDLPAYADWLGTDGEGNVSYFSAVLDESGGLVDDEHGTPTDGGAEQTPTGTEADWTPSPVLSDPMVSIPTNGLLAVSLGLGFSLSSYGLSGVLESPDDSDLDSNADELLLTQGVLVLTGDVDAEEVGDALTAEPESFFGNRFERREEDGEYAAYVSAESSGGTRAALVRDGAVLLPLTVDADDPVAPLQDVADVERGEAPRATDEHDDFEWLLRAAGSGDVSVGGYGRSPAELEDAGLESEGRSGTESIGSTEPAQPTAQGTDAANTPLFRVATGIVSTLSFVTGDEGRIDQMDGELASTGGDYDEADLGDQLGASATESSVSFDGDRMYSTATWNDPVGLRRSEGGEL